MLKGIVLASESVQNGSNFQKNIQIDIRDQEAAGSSPVTPTTKNGTPQGVPFFVLGAIGARNAVSFSVLPAKCRQRRQENFSMPAVKPKLLDGSKNGHLCSVQVLMNPKHKP